MPALEERAIHLRIESDLANVALVGGAVLGVCAGVSAAGRAHEIELCVVEVVTNAIKHAYQSARGREVEIRLRLSRDALVIEVSDSGRAMPAGVLESAGAEPVIDPADVASLPESGLGLRMVRQLMDDVRYESRRGCNVLTLVRRLSRCGAPARTS